MFRPCTSVRRRSGPSDFHLLAADGEHLVHGAVAHDLAHDGLGKIAQRLLWVAEGEQILLRLFDRELHHPLDERGVQIARHHGFLSLHVFVGAGVLIHILRTCRGKTEFEFLLACDFDDCYEIDPPRQLEVKAWVRRFRISTEALHDGHRIHRNGVEA
jgi:hypothetical protein